MQGWVLPILIGLIAAILLVAILFNDKQRFADLGALIQLQTSRPYYYGLNWIPVGNDTKIPPGATQGQISATESPLWMGGVDGLDSAVNYPVYNYYPKAALNPTKPVAAPKANGAGDEKQNQNQNLAFANPPQVFDSHKAYYWALSGGYPYPFPVVVMPPTDMDKVRGIEDKI